MPAPPATSNYIGDNIIAARHAYNSGEGMTQLALAHAIGWNGDDAGAQIARYEGGKVSPTVGVLQRIATALGVGIDALLLPAKK